MRTQLDSHYWRVEFPACCAAGLGFALLPFYPIMAIVVFALLLILTRKSRR